MGKNRILLILVVIVAVIWIVSMVAFINKSYIDLNYNGMAIAPLPRVSARHNTVGFIQKKKVQQLVNIIPPPNILSNLQQYIYGVRQLPLSELGKKRQGGTVYKKTPSSMAVSSLRFDVTKGGVNGVYVRVRTMSNVTVHGCNFNSRQEVARESGERMVAECTVEERPDHSHRILCASHGAKCYHLTVILRFCRYEAFSHRPRIQMWNHKVMEDEVCFHAAADAAAAADDDDAAVAAAAATDGGAAAAAAGSRTVVESPSWLLDHNGNCKRLMLHDKPLQIFSPEESCACIRRFDNVYLIGTSHIRFFSDFLLRTCMGKDLHNYTITHGNLQEKSVHYFAWGFLNDMHNSVRKQLDSWLRPNASIALWIQTGSWDFTQIHYQHAMEIGLQFFNQTLAYINSRIAESSTQVDFRIIATFPMPLIRHWNHFAVGAFNARMQLISMQHGVTYVEAFNQILPCCDYYPRLENNGNHYFIRFAGNKFTGEVGKNVYFGAFLPQVCPDIKP